MSHCHCGALAPTRRWADPIRSCARVRCAHALLVTQVYEAQAAQDKLDAAAANEAMYEAQAAQDKLDTAAANEAAKVEKARHSPSFARQLTWTHPRPSRALYACFSRSRARSLCCACSLPWLHARRPS